MKIVNKLVEFFTYDEDVQEEKQEEEKSNLNKELMEERKMYANKQREETEKKIIHEPVLEPVKKQVMFVDETFDRKEKGLQIENTVVQAPKYTDINEKKFKPSSYISPVHGLIKEAEEVEEYIEEVKTTRESDYSKIRSKAFGNAVFDEKQLSAIEEVEKEIEDHSAKIFQTSEIIDLQKRMQVDSDKTIDKNLTVDDAYELAQGGEVINNKTFTEGEENPQYLFDLLDELNEVSKDE